MSVGGLRAGGAWLNHLVRRADRQGAVVWAGSLVARDVPPYAVFAGGTMLRFRYDELTFTRTLAFHYATLTRGLNQQHAEVLERPVDEGSFDGPLYAACPRDR